MESIGEFQMNVDKTSESDTNQNIKQSPKNQENLHEPTQQQITLCSLGDASAKSSKITNLGVNLTSPVLPHKTDCSNVMPISAPAISSTGKITTKTTTTPAAAVALIGTSMANEHIQPRAAHHAHEHQYQNQSQPQKQQEIQHQKPLTLFEQNNAFISPVRGSCSSISSQQQTIEKLSRPLAFDKMEALVREMQDTGNGVPVRQQKIFLTSIPYAFMGYDLIEWLMDRLLIEESEALNIANQLCLHGYFFPVNDTKSLTVKDDSSLYRFQTPYYWPWQHKAPDNVEYAIYLTKRSLRNKQRHALEDYEAEALQSLHKNLKGKWDFISMQAEEQVRLAKERKKGDKIVGDSQERAYWRVHRPPPGQFTPLEPCPVPSRDRQGSKTNKKKSFEDIQRDVDYLKRSLNRTRMKMSQACESLVTYSETFVEYDFFLQPVLPSNPWVTEDITFWQLNNTFVDIPTEKRVKRWAISIEELVSDPTGLQEFTTFLEKEYSHENIRFWIAVNHLRRSAHSQVSFKVNEIYEEFLKPGAPCEINIDGKTMECVLKGLKNPSRFTFDSASEHIYTLLLKKDCYPRFIRSDHYKRLLESGIQPSHKKRFFNFSAVSGAKKKMTAALSNQAAEPPSYSSGIAKLQGANNNNINMSLTMTHTPSTSSNLVRRRGSDRSLTGSAHELTVIGLTKDTTNKVPHSHSQSNLSEIPFRDISKAKPVRLETTVEQPGSVICPWDVLEQSATTEIVLAKPIEETKVQLSVCPWEGQNETEIVVKHEILDERSPRISAIRHQNTVDSAEACKKMLIPTPNEHRRASVSFISSHTSEEQPGGILGFRTDNITSQKNLKKIPSNENCDSVFEDVFLTETHMDEAKPSIDQSRENTFSEELTNKPPLIRQISVDCFIENIGNSKDTVHSSSSNLATNEITPVVQLVQEVQIELIEEFPSLENNGTKIDKMDVEAISVDMLLHSKQQLSSSNISSSSLNIVAENSKEAYEKHDKLEGKNVEDMQLLYRKETDMEVKNEKEEYVIPAEELSPTSEEYQEGSQYGENQQDMCGYEITENEFDVEAGGYIPPAPTPAPSLAPLAELDLDNVEDDLLYEDVPQILPTLEPNVNVLLPAQLKQQHSTFEETKKRRKKRNLSSKNITVVSNEKETAATGILSVKDNEEKVDTEQNTVCPWEDESNSASGGTFVKTYATLGYL